MIAIVIPTWHRIEFTEMCLDSFFKYTNFDIVTKIKVFDNNSGKEMTDLLKSYDVEYEIGEFNNSWQGFNKFIKDDEIKNNNNIQYIGKVDNDVLFTKFWIEDIMNEFKKNKLIGSICYGTQASNGRVSPLADSDGGGGLRVFNKNIVTEVGENYRYAMCVPIMNKIKKLGYSMHQMEVGIKMLDNEYPQIAQKYIPRGIQRRPQ